MDIWMLIFAGGRIFYEREEWSEVSWWEEGLVACWCGVACSGVPGSEVGCEVWSMGVLTVLLLGDGGYYGLGGS